MSGENFEELKKLPHVREKIVDLALLYEKGKKLIGQSKADPTTLYLIDGLENCMSEYTF